MKVKSESEVSQSCPTLSNAMDCSLPGSSVHGIFQARALKWGPIITVNRKIRLIIFFGAKDGEALYSQQKQERELTVAQIMNSLLQNSD